MNTATQFPKISVITPSFNQAQFIERTITSVLDQNYPNLEYIIIDGQSTDDTLHIIEKYHPYLQYISEPDTGQAQAINKGFERSTGEIVCWLNSDDELTSNALFTIGTYFFDHPEVYFVYGNAEVIDESGRYYGLRGNVKPATFYTLVNLGDFIVQPAAFWRSELLRTVGFLDEKLRYCLDYEYWMRVAKEYSLHYIPNSLARERFHSQAKTTQASVQRIQEIEAVARRYGGNGTPHQFRAERSAIYLSEMFRQFRHRNFTQAISFGRQSFEQATLSPNIFPHLLSQSLGPSGVTQMRLCYDLFRTKFRKLISWRDTSQH